MKILLYLTKFKNYILSFIFVLFVLRLVIPQYIKYLLFPSVILFFIISLIFYINNSDKKLFNGHINIFVPVILSLIVYFVRFLFPHLDNVIIFKDSFNILIVFLFFISMLISKIDIDDFNVVINLYRKWTIVAVVIVASFGIIKLFLLIHGIKLSFLSVNDLEYPSGTSLAIDYNFFSLSIILGMILIIPFFRLNFKKIYNILIQIAFLILFVCAFFATSRRGSIFSFIILVVLNVYYVYTLIRDSSKLGGAIMKNYYLIFSTSSFLLLVFIYMFYIVKPNIFNKLLYSSSLNKVEVNKLFSKTVSRNETIFDGSVVTEKSGVNNLNDVVFNPLYPYTGWASGNYKLISELKGNNVDIVPQNAMGALIDKNEKGVTWNGNCFYISELRSDYIISGFRHIISIYCYVSPDFDGDWVMLNASRDVRGITKSYYDNTKKGIWQKLQLSLYADSGKFSSYFTFQKKNASTFSNLNGYVIFAYPEYEVKQFNSFDPLTWAGTNYIPVVPLIGPGSDLIPKGAIGCMLDSSSTGIATSNVVFSSTRLGKHEPRVNTKYITSVYVFASDDFNGKGLKLAVEGKCNGKRDHLYDYTRKGTWQKLKLENYSKKGNAFYSIIYFSLPRRNNLKDLKGYVIYAFPVIEETELIQISYSDSILLDKYENDDKIVSADTTLEAKMRTFSGIKGNSENHLSLLGDFSSLFSDLFNESNDSIPEFNLIMANDIFAGPRINRWRYAMHLYRFDYSFYEKFVGRGFLYMISFGNKFSTGSSIDYPHNPFLSVLLYSGFFGLLSYLWFLYYVFYYYWKYRKEYWVFGLSFLASFFFAFFSANSPFDPAIVGVFSILPYFIHYYHVKDKAETNLNYNEQIES